MTPRYARTSGIWEGLSEAAEAGIPVRLLLDATLDKDPSGNPATEVRFNEMGEMGLDMGARLVSPYHNFTVVHNKGWVVDDKVVISSVNLVRNAFEENREVGLIIRSPAIADWYARSFWEDWRYRSQSPLRSRCHGWYATFPKANPPSWTRADVGTTRRSRASNGTWMTMAPSTRPVYAA